MSEPPDHIADVWRHGAMGLHVVDLETGVIIDCNDADAALIGRTREEVVGRRIHEFHVNQEALESVLAALRAGEILRGVEAQLRHKDGSIVVVEITSSGRFDEEGNPVATRCFTRDVTERRTLLDRLERQARAIEEMGVPIVPIWSGVILVTIVGILDSPRAARLMEALLYAVDSRKAKYAIIDLTGIGTVDTTTADHVLKSCRAAGLMGCSAILTGMSPAVAITMVGFGVDLREVATMATPQDALRRCIVMHRWGVEAYVPAADGGFAGPRPLLRPASLRR